MWTQSVYQKPNFEALCRRGCEPKDPWLLAARYRVNSTPVHLRRPKSTPVGRVRRRRTISRAGSEGGESVVSHSTNVSDATCDSNKDFLEDFDFDMDEKPPEMVKVCVGSMSQKVYLKACRDVSVTPSTSFMKCLATDTVLMRNHVLRPMETRACAAALTDNSDVETLDMSGNGIGPVGVKYFADMIEDNFSITDLRLADNNLGSVGAKLITDALLLNSSITDLDLSGNGFTEFDAALFRTLLLSNTTLRKINLSHNCFRERGGEAFGEVLAKNKTLVAVNLSWNHLRRRGVVAIGKGLTNNPSVKSLNVAWNGFYLEGCRALARALERNRSLSELNLQANRIDKECLQELLKGLRKNRTLTSLKLSDNPITTEGAVTILKCIKEVTTMGLSRIDLGEQSIEKEFVDLLVQIQSERPLEVKYGVVLRDDTAGHSKEQALVLEDPILVLMEFMKLKNLRLIDLFQSLDKDGSRSLSNHEIKAGLLEEGMPLSEKSLGKLISKLDKNKNGEIDFGELMVGQKSHRRRLNPTLDVSKERDTGMSDREGDVARVRARLKELIHKKDRDILRRVQERRLASAFNGERRLTLTPRKNLRPASAEPSMATLLE